MISYVQQMYAQPFYHDPDEGDPPPPYDGHGRTRSRTRTTCSTTARPSTRASARSATAARRAARGPTARASSRCRRTSATAATATSPTATTSGVSRSACPWSAMPAVGAAVLHRRAVDGRALHPDDVHADRADAAEAARGRELHVPAALQGADDAGDGVVRARQGALRQHVHAVPRAGGRRPRPGRPVSQAAARQPAGPGARTSTRRRR